MIDLDATAHVRHSSRDECAWCGESWPCLVQDLRDDNEGLRGEVQRLAEELRTERQRSREQQRSLTPEQRAMLLRLTDMLNLFYGDRADEARLGIQANGGISLVIVPPARDLLTSLLLERARIDLAVAEVPS